MLIYCFKQKKIMDSDRGIYVGRTVKKKNTKQNDI